MSLLLRKLLGHVYCAEAGEADGGGAAPSAPPAPSAPAPSTTEAPSQPEPAAPAEKPLSDSEHTAAMQKAISDGLKEGGHAPAKRREDKPEESRPASPAEQARKRVEEEAKAKEESEVKERLKGKKTDDFMLSLEERRALGQSANRRFHDLIRYSKQNDETIKVLDEENKGLRQAKDTIMSIFAEHGIEKGEELIPLMRLHQQVKIGDFEGALRVVEHQRRLLLTRLGREAEGVDLLEGFPDLAKAVDEAEITRERAVELATHRRSNQQRTQTQQQQQHQQHAMQTEEARKQEAFQQIVEWENQISQEPGYAAKREKVSQMVGELVKEYPPHLWLSTIKRVYGLVPAEAPRMIGGNGNLSPQPLRPGASGGGLPDAKTMEDAIAGGLGYNPRSLRMN